MKKLSRIEVAGLLISALLLLLIALTATSSNSYKIKVSKCQQNLGFVYNALFTYRGENNSQFPWENIELIEQPNHQRKPLSTGYYFSELQTFLKTPDALLCPTEKVSRIPDSKELRTNFFASHPISYFVGIDSVLSTQAPLSGDRHLEGLKVSNCGWAGGPLPTLTKGFPASWQLNQLHKGRGNLLAWDGGVRFTTSTQLVQDFLVPGNGAYANHILRDAK